MSSGRFSSTLRVGGSPRIAGSRRHAVPTAALSVLAAATFGCSDPVDPGPPPEIRNVLLISIDTLRADHMGIYGFDRDTTPNLDSLARDGTLFRSAVSSAPITLPSHSTLFTGKYPTAHGVHDNNTAGLREAHTTLAEILKAEGFLTHAIVSGAPLASRYGLDQGFDRYQDDLVRSPNGSYLERPAELSAARAVEFLRRHGDQRFFLFLHLFDPHDVYAPPSPYSEQYRDDPYAGEIAYADNAVGQVLAELKGLKLYDSTLIVFVSDHGESRGQHGEPSHTFFIYQATQHVPLIIRAPGFPSGQTVDSLVGLVDVMPSVLGLLGLAPPAGLAGIDLAPEVRGERVARGERHLYLESLVPTKIGCNPVLGVVGERWKYIHTTRPELYDLSADPAETTNLALVEPAQARALLAELEGYLAGAEKGQQIEFEVDGQIQRALAALGYFGGVVEEQLEIDPDLDDPKDCVSIFDDIGRVIGLTELGKLRRARTIARELLRRRPDMADLYRMLGQIELRDGNAAEAVRHFRTYLSRTPVAQADSLVGRMRDNQLVEVRGSLATALLQLGRPEEAVTQYKQILILEPDHSAARDALQRLEVGTP
jgi:arylsulfatase A-like enzyme